MYKKIYHREFYLCIVCNSTLVIMLQGDCVTSRKFLEIPPVIEKAIRSLAYHKGMEGVITERVVAHRATVL